MLFQIGVTHTSLLIRKTVMIKAASMRRPKPFLEVKEKNGMNTCDYHRERQLRIQMLTQFRCGNLRSQSQGIVNLRENVTP